MKSSQVIHLVSLSSAVFVRSDHLRVTSFLCLTLYYTHADMERCEQTWQTDWGGGDTVRISMERLLCVLGNSSLASPSLIKWNTVEKRNKRTRAKHVGK